MKLGNCQGTRTSPVSSCIYIFQRAVTLSKPEITSFDSVDDKLLIVIKYILYLAKIVWASYMHSLYVWPFQNLGWHSKGMAGYESLSFRFDPWLTRIRVFLLVDVQPFKFQNGYWFLWQALAGGSIKRSNLSNYESSWPSRRLNFRYFSTRK